MPYKPLRVVLTLAGLVLIGIHLKWPDLKVDAITLGLVIFAALPWLPALIKSAEFPGGWKVEFADLKQAAAKIVGESQPPARASLAVGPAATNLSRLEDPNLALVGMRIEIERRLRSLAEKHGIKSDGSLTALIQSLRKQGVLTPGEAGGLQTLVLAGNKAAHGAQVDPGAADYAHTWGEEVIGFLDTKLAAT